MAFPEYTRSRNDLAFAFLRIVIGLLFLILAQYKVLDTQFTMHGGFQYWIHKFIQNGAYPFMTPILKDFVLPHATAIAFLVAYGELAIGVALFFGALTRAASFCGLIYMLSLLFSANYPGADAPFWQYFGAALDHLVLALCFLTFLIGDSESMLSITRWMSVYNLKHNNEFLLKTK